SALPISERMSHWNATPYMNQLTAHPMSAGTMARSGTSTVSCGRPNRAAMRFHCRVRIGAAARDTTIPIVDTTIAVVPPVSRCTVGIDVRSTTANPVATGAMVITTADAPDVASDTPCSFIMTIIALTVQI